MVVTDLISGTTTTIKMVVVVKPFLNYGENPEKDNAFQLYIHNTKLMERRILMSIIIDGKEYYGIIYKIENIITHKVYIGQTTHPKWFNGRYYYKGIGIERVYRNYVCRKESGMDYNKYLLRSIEKCGFDAFKVTEIFDTALTLEELNEKEAYYIEKFDSYKNGYNMTSGGDSISGYKRPTGKDCLNSKSVCQISLDGKLIKIWDSVTEASNKLGITASSISVVCNQKKRRKGGDVAKTAGGYVWVFVKDYDPDKDYSVNRPKQNMGHGSKIVLLLSDNGDIMQEFYSLNEASRILGITVESVRQICLHHVKNPRFNLIYKSEYIEEQRLNEKGFVA